MTMLDTTAKAVHAVSLFRALGGFVAPGSIPTGYMPPHPNDGGLELLELPGELARRGFAGVQLSHFFLPSTGSAYLDELRAAFVESGVVLECFLVDDGDLAHPDLGDRYRDWVSAQVEVGVALGVSRVRVVAGMQPPSPGAVAQAAGNLREIARHHPGVRLLTENWNALLVDDSTVHEVLDRAEGSVGFLIDLGNWTGPDKLRMLASVAPRAESCQAKVQTSPEGEIDAADFEDSLAVLLDAGYADALALVHRGPGDEWAKLDEAHAIALRTIAGRTV